MKNAIAGVIVGLFVTTSLAASGPVAAKQDPGGSASIVTVESGVHVFPSAVLGRGATLEAQVDSMVTQFGNRRHCDYDAAYPLCEGWRSGSDKSAGAFSCGRHWNSALAQDPTKRRNNFKSSRPAG